jgi:hypothetical protein
MATSGLGSGTSSGSSAAPSQRGPSALATQLGWAGLVPFVSGALLVWLVRDDARPYVTLSLSAYAAVIVSFLGGIHWGMVLRQPLPDTRMLVWGVLPSLVAWLGVMMKPGAGLVIAATMLLVCYAVDRRVYPRQGAAGWLTLRFRLTLVASLSCLLGAAGA